MVIFVVSEGKKPTCEVKLVHIKVNFVQLYEEDHGDCKQQDHKLNSKNG